MLEHLAPLLAVSPARRRREGTVYIVDGTLVPTRDRSIAASSKNYRYSMNLQVVIDADSRLVVAIGDPLPGSRNGCRAFSESGVDRVSWSSSFAQVTRLPVQPPSAHTRVIFLNLVRSTGSMARAAWPSVTFAAVTQIISSKPRLSVMTCRRLPLIFFPPIAS